MAKRTLTSPYAVEYLHEDGKWFIHSYENSPRRARQAARNFIQWRRRPVRVVGNPNNDNRFLGIVFELGIASG